MKQILKKLLIFVKYSDEKDKNSQNLIKDSQESNSNNFLKENEEFKSKHKKEADLNKLVAYLFDELAR